MQIKMTDRWHETFPGAHVGILLVGNIDNTKRATLLDDRKRELEAQLRETYAGLSRAELLELPVLKAYRASYKRFKQTYHVELQLESVAHKGKLLPNVSPLVDANFVAELQTFVLTAGHDANLLGETLTIDASLGGEPFVQMGGTGKTLRPGDRMMSDGEEVVCTFSMARTGARRSLRPPAERSM